jgi:small conductance mechanosensitive channel
MNQIQNYPFSLLLDFLEEIAIIAILLLLGWASLKYLSEKYRTKTRENIPQEELRVKAIAYGRIIRRAIWVLLWGWILFILLEYIGVPIGPIFAGVGIIGLAIGLGSQSLIRDFLSGIFLLMEGRYKIGDTVKIGLADKGKVIDITLRSTILETRGGGRLFYSNGDVRFVRIYSKKEVLKEEEKEKEKEKEAEREKKKSAKKQTAKKTSPKTKSKS